MNNFLLSRDIFPLQYLSCFNRRLQKNKENTDDDLSNEFSRGKAKQQPTYEFCHLLNISSCAPSEAMNDFVLSVYNPLARDILDTYIRIPVSSPLWDVKGQQGT